MEKKRIFLAMHYLEIGGAETSLIGLLNAIDYSRYSVDLFLHSHRGEMLSFVPKEVNLLPEIDAYAQIENPISKVIKNGCFGIAAARIAAKLRTWGYLRRHKVRESSVGFQYTAEAVSPYLPAINQDVEYDLAISFLQPHSIVRDKVRAKKKACWIHTDYSNVSVDVDRELPVWRSYDFIVSISDDVTRTFLQTFPALRDKVVLIENILIPDFVRRRACEFDPSKELQKGGGVCLLSVGRFSYAKNYENVPAICKEITEAGVSDVKWFIIGYGKGEKVIRSKIAEYGMQDHVFILGKKSNPYPYIKACDIYVQPSRYEGKSVTVREAQTLSRPVVITNYPTAPSQVKDGIDGVIVPQDIKACAAGIAALVRDKARQQSIVQYLSAHDYGKQGEIEKLYNLI